MRALASVHPQGGRADEAAVWGIYVVTQPDSGSVQTDAFHRQWRRVYRGAMRLSRSVKQRLAPKEPGSEYDTQTIEVMRRVLTKKSNGIDIGAAWGEILRPMVKLAPLGHHRAFEPLPHFAERLREEFPQVELHQVALSDHEGEAEFFFAVDAPGFSGLHRRPYPSDDVQVETLSVQVQRLDDLIDIHEPIDFLKIDVEGAEFDVLRGAQECLVRHRPVVVFEYSGESIPEYGVENGAFYDYLNELGMGISTMDRWLRGEPPLERSEFPKRRADDEEMWHWMYVAYDAQPGSTSVSLSRS
jgi:FkbM family methyltransferase